jgi:chromosome segregation protein
LERHKHEIQEKELELVHRERDLEHLGKDVDQFHQKIDVLKFEKEQLDDEGREIAQEREEASASLEAQEKLRGEEEKEVQALRQKVDDQREETERLRKISGIRVGRTQRTTLRERTAELQRELETSLVDYHQREAAVSIQREKVETLSNSLKEAEASSRYLRQELDEVRGKIHEEEIRTSEIQLKLQHLQDSMRERYGTTLSTSIGTAAEALPREEMSRRLEELKTALEGFGEVNLMAIEEYQELRQRHDFLTEQQADLQQALDSLKKAIARINRTTTKRFLETFHLVNERFKEVFSRLFKGGQASLVMLDEQDPSTTGVDIIAQPPGKKLQNIDLLSGGEKALVAIALIFGLFMIKPTPFCLLDEVDAPLDDANINRFIGLVEEFSKTSQFVFITHNKKTMEMADTLYGITMETAGVSKVVSVRLS